MLGRVPDSVLTRSYVVTLGVVLTLGTLFALTKIFPGGRQYPAARPVPVAVCSRGPATVIPARYDSDGNKLDPLTIVCPDGKVYQP